MRIKAIHTKHKSIFVERTCWQGVSLYRQLSQIILTTHKKSTSYKGSGTKLLQNHYENSGDHADAVSPVRTYVQRNFSQIY